MKRSDILFLLPIITNNETETCRVERLDFMKAPRPFRFDAEKALEVIVYISKHIHINDIYHVLKALYFADKEHLEHFGRLICGDDYIAMPNGPVPSGTYNLVKEVKGSSWKSMYTEKARQAFTVDGYYIKPLRDADLSYLSKSDISCLDDAIRKYGRLPFGVLKMKSHDAAYFSADLNGEIGIKAIAESLPDSEELLEELQEYL